MSDELRHLRPLRWWGLESEGRGHALVAAATIERAIELVVEYVADPLDVDDDPARWPWRSSADDLAPGVAQDFNLPAPPGAEGVYFVAFGRWI